MGKGEFIPLGGEVWPDPEHGGCARWYGSRTVATSSRGRVEVVRDPLNVMARLAEVVRENGTRGNSAAPRSVSRTR
ncbi:hypothetical protein CRG98_006536 [Punica granatum]|uniref:Uncharacterized protein n=1 Tax=Punica granatum TaxID=22663 RepID=A0A2I0KX30_PUNGR|nr:hypothetical protein CRG98_006536 [Punica granatum]